MDNNQGDPVMRRLFSRRRLLKAGGALAITPAIAGVLSACGGDDDDDDAP